MDALKNLKKEVYECNMELFRRSLVTFTFGNVSGIDRKRGVFVIKPSGVPYKDLSPEKMVVVDLYGQVVSGTLRPSSDTKTHALLYRKFLNIGGIAHTHSTFATAWSQAELPIPILGTTHADHLSTAIPCTAVLTDEQIKNDYEEETGNQIIQAFAGLSYEDAEMVLVARHGPFTWGRSPRQAVYNSVMVEELAKIAYLTLSLKPNTPALKQKLVEKHYFRKHGQNAYYGQMPGKEK